MPKAGLFAGETTQSAPADGAITTKNKGYQWMEYGNVDFPYQPVSGQGYSYTQYGYYGSDPNFLHPFRNQTFNSFTSSQVFSPITAPNWFENQWLYNLQILNENFGVYTRRRPINFQMYFGMEFSSMYPSETFPEKVCSVTHEISIDHPTWGFADWYWMVMSYDYASNTALSYIRNLTLGEEATKAVTITNNIPIRFDAQASGQSVCSWGGKGDSADEVFNGAISQLVLHDEYIDLSQLSNRNKFCSLDGVIDIGDNGENIFGEIPLVHSPRGFPQEANGTLFIGDLTDLYAREEYDRDDALPPVGT